MSMRNRGTKSGLIMPSTTKNKNNKIIQSFDFQLNKQPPNATATSKMNDDLINFLEHKLEDIEKKLQKSLEDYNILQNDYIDIQDKLSQSREKYKRAALLLTEYLDDIIQGQPNILSGDDDLSLNL